MNSYKSSGSLIQSCYMRNESYEFPIFSKEGTSNVTLRTRRKHFINIFSQVLGQDKVNEFSYGWRYICTYIFKEFEIFLWKKDAFDCAGIRAQVFRLQSIEIRAAIERSGLESQRSRKRLFSHRKISNSLNLNLICIYLRYKGLKLYTRTRILSHTRLVILR